LSPRAVIAEDEPLLAAALARELAALWPELEIAAIAANGLEALDAIAAELPEVVLLDIRMPAKSGLDVAVELAERWPEGRRLPEVVFVTAYDEHAVRAFELAAADYVLKPVRRERLARTVERLKARLAGGEEDGAPAARAAEALARTVPPGAAAPPRLRFLQAGAGNTVRMIPVDEVRYLKASDKYVAVITAEGESLVRTPLRELLAQLDPDLFRQVHRAVVVNLAHVTAAVRDDAGHLSLRLRGRTETVPVSRFFAPLFRPT
jgi:DNA-binding LytR/AlgR family response regulator